MAMDAKELHSTLAKLKVTPPDELRASLYLAQIQKLSKFLNDTLKTDLGPKAWSRLGTALQDPSLLDGFCALADRYTGSALAVELKRTELKPDPYIVANLFQ